MLHVDEKVQGDEHVNTPTHNRHTDARTPTRCSCRSVGGSKAPHPHADVINRWQNSIGGPATDRVYTSASWSSSAAFAKGMCAIRADPESRAFAARYQVGDVGAMSVEDIAGTDVPGLEGSGPAPTRPELPELAQ